MIGGYVENDHPTDAIEVYNQMRHWRRRAASKRDNLSILKACSSPTWGAEIHAHIREYGLQSDVRVGSALVQIYYNWRLAAYVTPKYFLTKWWTGT